MLDDAIERQSQSLDIIEMKDKHQKSIISMEKI